MAQDLYRFQNTSGNSFLKDIFKSMNNCVFWKTEENLRNSVNPPYDTSNRKSLRFFKDQLNYVPMQEFVGRCLNILGMWRRRQQKV